MLGPQIYILDDIYKLVRDIKSYEGVSKCLLVIFVKGLLPNAEGEIGFVIVFES